MQILANKIGVTGLKNATSIESQAQSLQPIAMTQSAMTMNDISSEFWKANRLSFAKKTIQTETLKTKIYDDTSVLETKIKKANKANKTQALRNMEGPVRITSNEIDKPTLKLLNKEFAKTRSLDDIKTVLQNPMIPSNVPITITEVASGQYKDFLKSLHKADKESTSPMDKVNRINHLTTNLQGNTIQVPQVSLSVSTKELAIALINHIQAGREYSKKELYSESPFFNDVFQEGGTYKISVNLLPSPTAK